MGAMSFLDLLRLLGLGKATLQLAVASLAIAEILLGQRQIAALPLQLFLVLRHAFTRHRKFAAPVFQGCPRLIALPCQALALFAQGGGLCGQTLAAFSLVLQVLLQPGNLGIGRIKTTLRLMQRIAGRVMGFPRLFQLALGLAQARIFRFQLGAQARHFALPALALCCRLAFFEHSQQVVRQLQLGLQGQILLRHLGLGFQLADLLAQLLAHVLDAQQVLAGILHAQLGFAAPFLVFGNSRRFFQKNPQLLGSRLDHARDHSLLDDGVGARSQPGTQENIGDVAATDVQVVDEIGRLTVAAEYPFDGNFSVLRPLPGGLAQAVVEDQLDTGSTHRLARGRTAENHVLHGFAAQLPRPRFAQHPAHRVDHVGLAATVRADNANPLPGNGDRGGIDEGLEAGEFYVGEAHSDVD